MAQQQYTNGTSLAYWGSIEWLNGAAVVSNHLCPCDNCLGESMYRTPSVPGRRLVIVSLNGREETLRHVNPKHLH